MSDKQFILIAIFWPLILALKILMLPRYFGMYAVHSLDTHSLEHAMMSVR